MNTEAELNKAPEDFIKGQRNNRAFKQYLKNSFLTCYQNPARVEQIEESEYLRELFENKTPTDYFKQAPTTEDKKRLYRSALVKRMTLVRAARLTNVRPKAYMNPVFNHEGMIAFVEYMTMLGKEHWANQEITRLGGVNGGSGRFIDSILDSEFDYWWDYSKMRLIMYLLVKNSMFDQKGYLKLLHKNGRIAVEVVRSKFVCEDPMATTPEDRQYLFYMKPMPCRDVERKYKLKKNSITPDPAWSTHYDGDFTAGLKKEDTIKTPYVLLIEGYFRDDTRMEKEKLFPNGRIVTFITNQKTDTGVRILKDQVNTLPTFPLIDLILEPDTEVSGSPMARDIAPIQEIDDRVMQQGLLNHEKVGSSKIFYEPAGVVRPDKIKNKVAELVPVDNMDSIYISPGVQTTGEGINLHSVLDGIGRDIAGIPEMIEGKMGGRIDSSKALLVTNENVNQRNQPAFRFLEDFYRRVFRVWGAMYLATQKEGDRVRLGEGYKTMYKLPFVLNSFVDDIEVSIGQDSTLPKDKESITNLMLELLKTPAEDGMPVVTRRSVLRHLELDDKELIEKEVAQAKQEREQIAQLAQQAQQASQAIPEIQKQMQALQAENEQLKNGMAKEQLKIQSDLEKSKLNSETSLTREVTRQEYKIAEQVMNKLIELGVPPEIARQRAGLDEGAAPTIQ